MKDIERQKKYTTLNFVQRDESFFSPSSTGKDAQTWNQNREMPFPLPLMLVD